MEDSISYFGGFDLLTTLLFGMTGKNGGRMGTLGLELRREEQGVCVCVCAFMCAYVRASECSAHVQYGVLCEILLALPAIEMVEKFGWGQFTHSSKSLFAFACPCFHTTNLLKPLTCS